ncbi:biopolymer transporter ExbD [bacterium]|nr:biopolymer transporter ExbD [bacterium]MBU4561002.1 biopolymer transporter ExbD [bacterium]MCG2677203.1 biopolymer transporter ExbD [bacterium]
MQFEGRRRISTRLNIAPLIDVVFLLLIFFMLSSHFVTQPGIKITLPSAITAKLHPEEDIIISITEDSNLYLNERLVTLENLLEQLRIEITKTEKKTVIIKADEKIDLGLAVKVMDIAKQADAQKLIISTRLKEDVKR